MAPCPTIRFEGLLGPTTLMSPHIFAAHACTQVGTHARKLVYTQTCTRVYTQQTRLVTLCMTQFWRCQQRSVCGLERRQAARPDWYLSIVTPPSLALPCVDIRLPTVGGGSVMPLCRHTLQVVSLFFNAISAGFKFRENLDVPVLPPRQGPLVTR